MSPPPSPKQVENHLQTLRGAIRIFLRTLCRCLSHACTFRETRDLTNLDHIFLNDFSMRIYYIKNNNPNCTLSLCTTFADVVFANTIFIFTSKSNSLFDEWLCNHIRTAYFYFNYFIQGYTG